MKRTILLLLFIFYLCFVFNNCIAAKILYYQPVKELRDTIKESREDQEKNIKVLLLEAKKAEIQKKYDEAISCYYKILNINFENAEVYYLIGNLNMLMEDYEEASFYYLSAIELKMDYEQAYYKMGIAAGKLNNWEEAIFNESIALELMPNDTNAILQRGIFYFNSEENEKAIEDYSKVLKFDPRNLTAYYNRGLAYYELKKYHNAITDLKKSKELKYYDILNNKTPVNDLKNNKNVIIESLGQAKENFKYLDIVEIILSLGNVYQDKNKYNKALNEYNQAIKLNNNLALAYYHRGFAYLNIYKYEKSLNDFEKAIMINPKYGEAYFGKSQIYSNNKEFPKAIEQILKAIELNPEFAVFYNELAEIYIVTDRPQNAKEILSKAQNFIIEKNDKVIWNYLNMICDIMLEERNYERKFEYDSLMDDNYVYFWYPGRLKNWLEKLTDESKKKEIYKLMKNLKKHMKSR